MFICAVKDCNKKHQAKGYCLLHYYRWERHGNTKTVKKAGSKPIHGMAQTRVYKIWSGVKMLRYSFYWFSYLIILKVFEDFN